MKKFFILVLTMAVFAACNNKPAGEEAKVGDAQDAAELAGGIYDVDTAASIINWEGAKIAYNHTGTIKLQSGVLGIKDGNITSGMFTMDMNTIENTDLEGDKKVMLEAHLKGTADDKKDHFFNVTEFPTADFEITSVTPTTGDSLYTHEIAGNLTMKGITKNVTFKANVKTENGVVTATSQNFTIDRTAWNVKHLAKILGVSTDDAVKDEIGLQIDLVAKSSGDDAATETETK